jgi:prepilin-type N-terminal cleavage/methylation domain-containing protein/prepilin-type processing-associated H-X9-DG protein
MSQNRRFKAFTLIELLVVIVVISILAAILFPVFARARENARKAACMSNLKQIGLAVAMYSQDYDETYPIAQFATSPATNWWEVLAPYISPTVSNGRVSIFTCPTAGPIGRYSGGYGWNIMGTGWNSSPYDYNGFGNTSGSWRTPSNNGPVTLSQVTEPSTTIMVADPASNGTDNNAFGAYGNTDLSYIPVLHGGQVGPFKGGVVAVVPGGGGNYLFADGHVKWLAASQSYCSIMWDVDKTLATKHPAHCGTLKP